MYTRPVKTTAVSEIIPDHLSVNNKQYIDFLDGYIKFLEQHESIIDYLRIIENNDIDTSNSIEDHYKNIFGSKIPSLYKGDSRLLYKDLNKLYNTAGSVDSIKLFFKIFYQSPEVEVKFPKEHLLIPSPSKSDNGLLSNSSIKIHDSKFYQLYSYVISNTKISQDIWGGVYNKGTHPLGYVMFSEMILSTILNGSNRLFKANDTTDCETCDNTCLEELKSYVCSSYILELIGDIQPIISTSRVVDNSVRKMLILYDVERPLGMRAWLDNIKHSLITTSSSWDNYTINDTIYYRVPGNIEAELETLP
jgi:hypothetical protein